MFLSQAKLSEFKNIVSLSEQQATNIFATTKNLKMHQHLVLIWSRQETSCDSFFLEKKTFCNSENKPTHGHISPKVIWNINSIQWYLGLVIKPSAACVSALIWGAVTRSRPCVADSRTVGQLRAHRQQCLTHPQFSIVQTNANHATADTVDGLRRNCTRWGMDVDPRQRIESNEMAAEMGDGRPLCTGHVPALHPSLLFNF